MLVKQFCSLYIGLWWSYSQLIVEFANTKTELELSEGYLRIFMGGNVIMNRFKRPHLFREFSFTELS